MFILVLLKEKTTFMGNWFEMGDMKGDLGKNT